jgi:spore maturation protein SpmA
MALNYIWIAFFLVAFLVAILKLIFLGDTQVFGDMVQSTFDMAKVSVDISIYLIGVISLWQGIMKIGEEGGAVNYLTRIVSPFFTKLFPELPKNHPAIGSMMMNFSANMLGLDNAATPLGLKAMQDLQSNNDKEEVASNAMIMFIVLNTSGLTIVPVSVMAIRAAQGAANPADVFLPILLATYFASLGGLIAVALKQRINLLQPTILAWLGGITAIIASVLFAFSNMNDQMVSTISNAAGNGIILGIIAAFLLMALRKKVNVYETFIEGAKDGFSISIKIIPYLVAILVAIGVFRASGAMDYLVSGMGWFFALFLEDTRFVDALPTALMKPLSGSGARGMMVEQMTVHGADSFYTLAVYFGSVSIRKTRYALGAGLFADLCGIVAAIVITYIFFG